MTGGLDIDIVAVIFATISYGCSQRTENEFLIREFSTDISECELLFRSVPKIDANSQRRCGTEAKAIVFTMFYIFPLFLYMYFMRAKCSRRRDARGILLFSPYFFLEYRDYKIRDTLICVSQILLCQYKSYQKYDFL